MVVAVFVLTIFSQPLVLGARAGKQVGARNMAALINSVAVLVVTIVRVKTNMQRLMSI